MPVVSTKRANAVQSADVKAGSPTFSLGRRLEWRTATKEASDPRVMDFEQYKARSVEPGVVVILMNSRIHFD
jgi:hypothetical protein